MMEPQDREELKIQFQQLKERLSRQLPSLKESSQPVAPDNSIGRLTRMDAIQSQEMNQATYREVQNQLVQIDHALSRIDDPDFGLCAECEEPIPQGRLKAMPGSMVCVSCARKIP